MLFHSVRNGYCLFVVIAGVLVAILHNLFYLSDITCNTNVNSSYTYIIVGAGTSGCVLASRLSEDPSNTVILIEAGAHFNIFSKYPLFATLLQKSKHDWLYESVSQRWSSKGFFNQKQALPRGKGLGGSGLMNFMMHDIDLEYLNVLRRFIGLRNFNEVRKFINGEDAVQSYFLHLFFNTVRNTAEAGYPTTYLQLSNTTLSQILQNAVLELNSSHLEYNYAYSKIHNGQRWASYHSHLKSASKRQNLHVLCNHEVVKIIFENRKAVGVTILDSYGNHKKIYCGKEILLSAGAINSPKLLLLSGIGNESALRALNIPVVAHVPGVGLNMHDHFQMPLYISIKEPISVTLTKLLQFKEIYNYFFYGKGLFNASPIAGTVRLKPDINLILFGIGSTDESIFRNIGNYLTSTFSEMFPLYKNTSQEGFIFLAGCGKPKSRGFIKLSSNDPASHPIIDPKYLQVKTDLKCIRNAVKLAATLLKTRTFREIGPKLHWPQFKQCRRHKRFRNQVYYINCIIRMAAISSYHQAGTCKIGAAHDLLAVVDNEFKIKGVSGLRIVDASILPMPTYAFPNSMVILVAEIAAVLIKLS